MEARKVKRILAGLGLAALLLCLGLAPPALAGDKGKGEKAGQQQGQGQAGGKASVAGQKQGQDQQKSKNKSGRYEWLVPVVEGKKPDQGGASH